VKDNYIIGTDENGEYIECLKCGMKSYNPNDIENKYCGNCHEFLGIDHPE
jgi:ribosomal protein L37E